MIDKALCETIGRMHGCNADCTMCAMIQEIENEDEEYYDGEDFYDDYDDDYEYEAESEEQP
jgi:hypothetical protein